VEMRVIRSMSRRVNASNRCSGGGLANICCGSDPARCSSGTQANLDLRDAMQHVGLPVSWCSDDERNQAILDVGPIPRIDRVHAQKALLRNGARELQDAIAEPQRDIPGTGVDENKAQNPNQLR
jgi:hypothetical protein